MKMNEIIFERFASITAKQWKQKIQYELKGLDYQNTLVKNSSDGIPQLPFYSESDLKHHCYTKFPQKINACIHIIDNNEILANTKAVQAIEAGFTCIYFSVFNSNLNVDALLQNIAVKTFINPHFLNVDFSKYIHSKYNNVTVLCDPIGKIAQTGNWYRNFSHDFDQLNNILDHSPSSLMINLSLFHDAGATPVQQLAYSLAQLLQYDQQVSLKKCNSITYSIAVGTDFFMEIAKLKALRVLTDSYFQSQNNVIDCVLIQQKSQRNIHLFDSDLNHEISTLEHQIGQYGGVNYITTYPENYIYFEEEIDLINEQNHQLTLKTKNEYSIINDATFIEKLTQQLIDKSLILLKSIEQGGGFTNQLHKGIIQKKIKEKESIEQKAFNKQFTVKIPITKNTPIQYPFLKTREQRSFWQPINKKRLTAPQEKPIWDKLYSNG